MSIIQGDYNLQIDGENQIQIYDINFSDTPNHKVEVNAKWFAVTPKGISILYGKLLSLFYSLRETLNLKYAQTPTKPYSLLIIHNFCESSDMETKVAG